MCILIVQHILRHRMKQNTNINWIMLKNILKLSDKTRELKNQDRWIGAEMCSDSIFLNISVLSVQSTLAIQKSKKNTVRKIRMFLMITIKFTFFSL